METVHSKCIDICNELRNNGYNDNVPIRSRVLDGIIYEVNGRTGWKAGHAIVTMMCVLGALADGGDGVYWLTGE